jgi:antitoxin HigA-1
MKERLDWFKKYQQQKGKRMKKLLPGKTLAKDFMKPRGLTPDQVAKDIAVPRVSARHMNEIVQGRRAITFEIAFRLGRYLGSSAPQWWSTLVSLWEIELYEAYHQWSLAQVKWSAAFYKRLSAELKQCAGFDTSLLAEAKECLAFDKLHAAKPKKFYALAKLRLRALLLSGR